MKSLLVVLLLSVSALGSPSASRDGAVTGLAGRSWLTHLNRGFEETSMGKTGHLGPGPSEEGASVWQFGLSTSLASQPVKLRGADIYRLNCQSCHGESGGGAPPEINSVINPVRATSVTAVMERMKATGMNMTHADAAKMAEQSKEALLQRLYTGGQDMPAFPHLNDAEVHALIAYLKQLSGLPGAEHEQVSVTESPMRVGEHIVKSTCHICHSAYGANPNPQQIAEGSIPPLSALTSRVTLPEFVRKVTTGAPIVMGEPAAACRGRMPVFYYLSQDEAADVYLYLTLYPPYKFAALDPSAPVHEPDHADADLSLAQAASIASNIVPPSSPSLASSDILGGQIAPSVAFGLFLMMLMAGGFAFTVRECMRLSALAEGRASATRTRHMQSATARTSRVEEDDRLIA